jgi:hypothetical protein
VIPGTIPAEFECHSKFRRNFFINLAGPSAKIDSSGIARIPPDSGRNQWGTVKTSYELQLKAGTPVLQSVTSTKFLFIMVDTPASGSESTEIDLSVVTHLTFYKASTTRKGKKQTTKDANVTTFTMAFPS